MPLPRPPVPEPTCCPHYEQVTETVSRVVELDEQGDVDPTRSLALCPACGGEFNIDEAVRAAIQRSLEGASR